MCHMFRIQLFFEISFAPTGTEHDALETRAEMHADGLSVFRNSRLLLIKRRPSFGFLCRAVVKCSDVSVEGTLEVTSNPT
jgi:hypothetical protein